MNHSRRDYDVRMLIEALERALPPAPAVTGPAPPMSAPAARRPVESVAV